MKISLIAAVATNGVIGKEGDLPWKLPADLRWFQENTRGHFVLMGRRTWDSFPGPLPDRTNVVISRGTPSLPEGVLLASSLEEALALAREAGESEAFVAGGARIYMQAFPEADRVYLTRVHASFIGDTWFPAVDLGNWRIVHREVRPADKRNPHPHSFLIYENPASTRNQDEG